MNEKFDVFHGTSTYITSDSLRHAVNVATSAWRSRSWAGSPRNASSVRANARAARLSGRAASTSRESGIICVAGLSCGRR